MFPAKYFGPTTGLIAVTLISSCASIDLSPGWRNRGFRCQSIESCSKRLKAIVTHEFSRRCPPQQTPWELDLRVSLSELGNVTSNEVESTTNDELAQCATNTVKSLEPYFELTESTAGKEIISDDIIFSFKSD